MRLLDEAVVNFLNNLCAGNLWQRESYFLAEVVTLEIKTTLCC